MDETKLENIEEKMKAISEEEMKKTFWKSMTNEGNIEPMWFTKTIKKEISRRREYNKKKGMPQIMKTGKYTTAYTNSRNKRYRL